MSIESIGPYRLLGELGRGAMGVVFRALDPAIDREVAIKIIQTSQFASPEERSELKLRFAREAAAAGKLSHPNIVTIHQLGEEGDLQYLVQELVNGCSLEKTLSSGRPQDLDTALSILTQVADALDYAHQAGIVHRDVKPANILIRPDGVAKITDFGIARITSQTVTRSGFTFGTPAYMSPEQIETANVTGKADQYSLGVIAYQMLSGKKPFEAETGPGLVFQMMSKEPPPLHTVNPALPPRVSEVIGKVLAKKPEDRFASCLEFTEQLAESLTEGAAAVNAPPKKPISRPASRPSVTRAPLRQSVQQEPPAAVAETPKPRSRLGLWIAAGVAAVAAATGAWVWWPHKPEPNSARVLPLSDTKILGKDGTAAASRGPVTRVNPKNGLTYVRISPGKFQMGCSAGDGECYDDEKPAHQVTISRAFWIGQTEVTQEAWQNLMVSNPSGFKGARLPVSNIGWSEAQAFCKAAGMRLPTEAEWEYAARAGSDGSRYSDVDRIAWYGVNGAEKPHDVGTKQPNPWGLYDTLGNVWEWVADWKEEYPAASAIDPLGPPSGSLRTLRGGAWGVNARNARVSMRLSNNPAAHNFDLYFGVRCAGN